MNRPSVTIIDYGVGNLLNVARAFEHCGARVRIVEDPLSVNEAERLVVPGVGAFSTVIAEVVRQGFADAIRCFSSTGRPVFGICVGMQILFDFSEEFGEHAGLSVLPGRVVAVPKVAIDGSRQRVPHIGWNHLEQPLSGRDWRGTLFDAFAGTRPAAYFVHSFAAVPDDASDRLADFVYGGHRLTAAVQRGSLVATQFHPERSGRFGLAIIERFLAI